MEEPQPEKRQVVVNGLFSVMDSSRINLSFAKPTDRYEPNQFIREANMKFHRPDGSFNQLEYMTKGTIIGKKTEGNFIIPPATSNEYGIYKLTATFPDGNKISANTYVPEPVRIEYVDCHRDSAGKNIFVHVKFMDNKIKHNYYAITASSYYHGATYTTSHENIEIESNSSFVEAEIWGPVSQVVFSDRTFNNSLQEVIIKTSDYHLYNSDESDSTVLVVKLLSISDEYYKYALSFYQQVIAEQDFYAEPVSVFNNIEGGYGIFAGYSCHSASVINIKGNIKYRIE